MKYFTLIFLQIFSSAIALADSSSYDDSTCDSVCTQLVDQSNDKQVGITGSDGWTSSDIAWCAANPYSASNPPMTSTLATQQNRCQYNNTQVLTYCEAYEKIQSAQGMETPLLVLDVAGAAMCGLACAGVAIPGANGALIAGCRIDSTAASAMDIYDAIILQSDPTSRALTGVMGAAGLGIEGAEYVAQEGTQLSTSSLKNFFLAKDTSSKKNSCFAAGVLAAGAGMRAWDMAHQQQSKQSACNDVKGLLSNSPVIGVVVPPSTPVASGGTSGGAQSLAHGGSSISGSGAGNLASQVACVAQNGVSQCGFANQGQSSAATDGGLLNSSGIGQTVAQQMGSGVPTVSGTPDAAAMIKSAMGDNASGDVATAIADVAKAAQQDGQKLAKASGSYDGASAVASAPKAAPGFGGFNFDSPTTDAKKEEVKFERAPASASGDIWHADFKGSIFQIVSSKIVETKPRVDNLDWTTPLNRALMGLPSQKAAGGLK